MTEVFKLEASASPDGEDGRTVAGSQAHGALGFRTEPGTRAALSWGPGVSCACALPSTPPAPSTPPRPEGREATSAWVG